ncbi:hypothetical protein [Anaeromyxobacter dehalogenans]|nr:hypothetical protein [Anaeromyxobacter dehalogenans]
MTSRRVGLAAVLVVACAGGDQQPYYVFGEPAPDEAAVDLSCETPVEVLRTRTFDDPLFLDTHVTCPPDAFGWSTYDETTAPRTPVAFHCEWRCVDYACAPGQDVRIDFGMDGHVLAIVSGASAYCAGPTLVPPRAAGLGR